jgi:hypothetical protein
VDGEDSLSQERVKSGEDVNGDDVMNLGSVSGEDILNLERVSSEEGVGGDGSFIVSAEHFCTDADGFIVHAHAKPDQPLSPPFPPTF